MGATILLHNFTAIVTVYTHSHPIAKVLYIGSVIKNFSVYHLTINNLSMFFLFFVLTQNGAGKRKNNGRINSNLNYLGIIQTSITKHTPKMYCYAFGKTYYRLLAIAGIVQQSIIYLTGMRIYTIPCPGSLN